MKIENFRKSQVIEVIETVVLEGEGTEAYPYQEITYYSRPDGQLLAKTTRIPSKP